MEAMRGQGGIQMLLRAEQEAQQTVSNARNSRTVKLKQAKDEAEQDIASYRASLEEEHQRKISENTGSSGGNVKRLEEETETKTQQLKDAALSISSDVVRMLMKHVTTVKN